MPLRAHPPNYHPPPSSSPRPSCPAARQPHTNPPLSAPSAFRGAPGADFGHRRTATSFLVREAILSVRLFGENRSQTKKITSGDPSAKLSPPSVLISSPFVPIRQTAAQQSPTERTQRIPWCARGRFWASAHSDPRCGCVKRGCACGYLAGCAISKIFLGLFPGNADFYPRTYHPKSSFWWREHEA